MKRAIDKGTERIHTLSQVKRPVIGNEMRLPNSLSAKQRTRLRLSDYTLKASKTVDKTWKKYLVSYSESGPVLNKDAISFWREADLEKEFTNFALEILSIPASSGAVEGLF